MRKRKFKIITRLPRISPRARRRLAARKRVPTTPNGIIHVQASFRNTIVSVTDTAGRVIFWSSAGICGFRGSRRRTPFAAQTAARDAVQTVVDRGMERARVMIKGAGRGRDGALRGIFQSGIRLISLRDVTPLPHNGCRPPKRRRL